MAVPTLKGGDIVGEFELHNLRFFTITPETLREIALKRLVTSGPGVDRVFMPKSAELETINDMTQDAVRNGRVFDFGYWPNDAIKVAGHRGGKLYSEGALAHPFRAPYIFMHTWDDSKSRIAEEMKQKDPNFRPLHSSAYLINPFPRDRELRIDFEAMVFEGIMIEGQKLLGVGDRIVFSGSESTDPEMYRCAAIPVAFRFMSMLLDPAISQTEKNFFVRAVTNDSEAENLMQAAIGNVLDPVLMGMLILNTRSVPRTLVRPDEKLNRKRAKSGKQPIPPYCRVDSKGYITAISNVKAPHSRGESLGGTHASPIMHLRQGHWRHYQNNERTFIRDTLVNASEAMREEFMRTYYRVKQQETEK